MTGNLTKVTFWRAIVALIFLAGGWATYSRFLQGFQVSTNLNDAVPWGLWVGLGTLCGVGLSAGGFAIAAAVYILGFERYRPILRASILISFLGYLSVVAGMFYELGLPWRIYHPIYMWQRRSVLFEVAWCVMLYTTVLTLEFAPSAVEKIPFFPKLRAWFLHWHHRVLIGLVLVGVLLSSLHQSFLGGLFLITKGRLHPLWYSTSLPSLFYLSAIPAGLALTIMALYLSGRRLGVRIEAAILEEIARVVAMMLTVYAIYRGLDLARNGAYRYFFAAREETLWFWTEIVLLLVAPLLLLSRRSVRTSPQRLYWTCSLVVMGFMANRLNVSITGLQAASGTYYVPSWMEFASTLALITACVVVFRWAALSLDIFVRPDTRSRWLVAQNPAQA